MSARLRLWWSATPRRWVAFAFWNFGGLARWGGWWFVASIALPIAFVLAIGAAETRASTREVGR